MHLLHFFVPHKKNNHRAKLLHNVSLLVLILAVALVSTFGVYLHKTHPEVLGISYQVTETELLNLTNYEREQNGLSPLKLDQELTVAAHNKADHMFKYNYWAHFAPDGTSPWDFIRGAGYSYSYAGENLAKGFTTSSDAVNAWMNSPTHRANILSPKFKDVGFFVEEGRLQGEDTILIVQEFGARDDASITDTKDLIPNAVNTTSNGTPEVKGSSEVQLPEGDNNLSNDALKHPLLDVASVAKVLTFLLLSALLVALILDFIIIEKKKIPRVVGNNLDHIILITVFIAFIFMAKLGNII
jgi:hypothetical protein